MKRFLFLAVALFFAWQVHCRAQDTHYWTQQFGTRSALLGGAVVAGLKDNTAVYYNPASLAFSDTGSISVTGNLYRIESFRIKNALGNAVDFKSKDLGSVPLILAGMFRTHNARLRIGYGIFQPIDFNFKAAGRLDGFYPIVNDQESPGNEEFICQRDVSSTLHETMVAFGLGYRINQHWAIGLSNFFSARSQAYTYATLARAYLNDPDHTLVTATVLQNFSYFNLRYSAKLGLAWQDERFSAGLNVSSPGLRLAGKGTVGADYTGTNIRYNGQLQDILADGIQPKLKAVYKYPLSLSAGFAWTAPRTTLAFSGQYFAAEAAYNMLQGAPAPFVRPAGAFPMLGADQFLVVRNSARAVIDGVLGFEQKLSSTVTLQGSLRNDMSYYDKDLDHTAGIRPDLTTWNIYTLTVGAAIGYGRSLFSIGIMASGGSDDHYAQQGNYSQPGQDGFLRGVTTITHAGYSSFGLLVGFKYTFRKV